MKKHTFLALLASPIFLLAEAESGSQDHKKCPICGTMYNTETVETVSGTIIKLENAPAKTTGWQAGIEIL